MPNNPHNMKKLVLLQSPAPAAEIKRVLKAVREKRMRRDELDIENPLDVQLEKTLLGKGGEFEKVVDAARKWERTYPPSRRQQCNVRNHVLQIRLTILDGARHSQLTMRLMKSIELERKSDPRMALC